MRITHIINSRIQQPQIIDSRKLRPILNDSCARASALVALRCTGSYGCSADPDYANCIRSSSSSIACICLPCC